MNATKQRETMVQRRFQPPVSTTRRGVRPACAEERRGPGGRRRNSLPAPRRGRRPLPRRRLPGEMLRSRAGSPRGGCAAAAARCAVRLGAAMSRCATLSRWAPPGLAWSPSSTEASSRLRSASASAASIGSERARPARLLLCNAARASRREVRHGQHSPPSQGTSRRWAPGLRAQPTLKPSLHTPKGAPTTPIRPHRGALARATFDSLRS
jgi:hypothetical protein